MGSSFQRQGAVYRKERLVIFKEDRLGGRVRVTVEEERVPCASTLAAFVSSSHPKRERDREAHLNYYASAYNRGR